jgi:molybdopterin converting factor small subunit
MRVTITFFAQVRLAAGCESLEVDVDSTCCPAEAIRIAANKLPEAFREMIYDSTGTPRRSVLLVVDQQQQDWASSNPLAEGATIMVLPPIAGG